MFKIRKYIIALLLIVIIINICAQSKKDVSLKFKPDSFIESISFKDTTLEKIKMDSLFIVDKKLDSVLTIINNSISSKSIWKHFYITIAKISGNIFVEIIGNYTNEELFKNKGKYYEYDTYGFLNYYGRKIYISTYNIDNNEIELFFKKTGEQIFISKEIKDILIVASKFENPMWLYEFKCKNLILVKSANLEFNLKKF